MADGRRPVLDVTLHVNGRTVDLAVEPRDTLADVIRRRLYLTGTKVSCDSQVCGTCTVLVDGLAVSSCTYLAADAAGREVTTIEGLADPDTAALSDVQQSFIDHAGFQCGYCTPGFVLAATALLDEQPRPTREDVVEYLEGNICRCTGYESILESILAAAERRTAR